MSSYLVKRNDISSEITHCEVFCSSIHLKRQSEKEVPTRECCVKSIMTRYVSKGLGAMYKDG